MRARRVDHNHNGVLTMAKQVGAEVLDLHALPGALDALVGWRSKLFLVEIKDGSKTTSRRKTTAAEDKTIERFRLIGCPVLVVTSGDDLLRQMGAID